MSILPSKTTLILQLSSVELGFGLIAIP